jgi:hypothetical protein
LNGPFGANSEWRRIRHPNFRWRGSGNTLGEQQTLSGRLIAMLSWGVIAYGGALSALLAVLLALAARERAPAVLVVIAAGAFAGPVGWNAILRATAANQFFVDAPIPVFPISWQDTGSGVVALAILAVILGIGPLRTRSGARLTLLSLLGGLAALIVDVYLY